MTISWQPISTAPKHGQQILIFSPVYTKLDPMRYRMIDCQFAKLCTEATHWAKLVEPTPSTMGSDALNAASLMYVSGTGWLCAVIPSGTVIPLIELTMDQCIEYKRKQVDIAHQIKYEAEHPRNNN